MPRRKFETMEQLYVWLDTIEHPAALEPIAAAGNLTALVDAAVQSAVDHQGDDQVPVPRWVLDQALAQVRPAFETGPTRRGRPASRWDLKTWRRDQIDWERYCRVWMCRLGGRARWDPDTRTPSVKRADRIAFVQEQRTRGSSYLVNTDTAYPWTAGNMADDVDVFEAVSLISAGSLYAGAPRTIWGSYRRVTRALARGQSWRYYRSVWCRYDRRQTRHAGDQF